MNGLLNVLDGAMSLHPIGAICGFVLLRALCVVYPPAPGLPVDLVAIRLFGPELGFGFTEVGIMIGATVAFVVARLARHSVVTSTSQSRLSVLANRVMRSVDNADERNQFFWWFTVRLLTNPLFDPLSYAAGLSEARFYPYFLGTLFGNVPSMTLFFVVANCAIGIGTKALVAAMALFGLAIWHVAVRWLTHTESQ